jgi:hypothetical protein
MAPLFRGKFKEFGRFKMIAVSIVSHGHGAMVESLVNTLLTFQEVSRILVTRNIPEALQLRGDGRVELIDNPLPKGFGENHNAAFQRCDEAYFCPLNPDIELSANPFPGLLAVLDACGAGLAAPLVVAPSGSVEDSMRHFPTPFSVLLKALGGRDGRYVVAAGQPLFFPEWVAGMFMLFRREVFAKLGGFDKRFFLYYEDVDICLRAWRAGFKVVACPDVSVIHDAQRDSRKSFRHLRWHLASMARFLVMHYGRFPSVPSRDPVQESR